MSVVVLVGSVASQLTGTETKTSTTPVPILRNINTQNGDGSYTYGFESADGTYKIETRFKNGEIKGKYGYLDNDGLLREATYGGSLDGGFDDNRVAPAAFVENLVTVEKRPARPGSRFAQFKARKFKSDENTKIAEDSVEDVAPVAKPVRDEPAIESRVIKKQPIRASPVVKQPIRASPIVRVEKPTKQTSQPRIKSRFSNFKPRNGGELQAAASSRSVSTTTKTQGPFNGRIVTEDLKVVNGRRAVLKKRLRFKTNPRPALPVAKPTTATISPPVLQKQQQRSNEEALRSLGAERQKVLNLFQKRFNIPTNITPQPQVNNKGFQGHLDVFRQPTVQTQPQVPQQTFVPEVVRSSAPQQTFVPQQTVAAPAPLSFDIWKKHPYISGYDSNIGAYSVNYGTV